MAQDRRTPKGGGQLPPGAAIGRFSRSRKAQKGGKVYYCRFSQATGPTIVWRRDVAIAEGFAARKQAPHSRLGLGVVLAGFPSANPRCSINIRMNQEAAIAAFPPANRRLFSVALRSRRFEAR